MHVEVGGLTIAYERAGTGPPVALAHGFVGDARSTWDSQIEGLADEFTVIAWDAPGAGGSAGRHLALRAGRARCYAPSGSSSCAPADADECVGG